MSRHHAEPGHVHRSSPQSPLTRTPYLPGSNTYNPKSGKLLWTKAIADPQRLVRAGGLLYVTSGSGSLMILSPADGKTITAGTAYGPTHSVVVAGGRIYAGGGAALRTYAP
jgi:outer membrane protein assembly factor BamB